MKSLVSQLDKLEKLAAARQAPATLPYRLRVVNTRDEAERLPLPPVVTYPGRLTLRRQANLDLYESPGEDVLPINVNQTQYEFLDTLLNRRADVLGFCAGVGSGKSRVGAKGLCLASRGGSTYCIVAPNYGMLHDSTRKTFEIVCRQLGMYVEGAYVETPRPRTTLSNGANIIFRSADDPETLRGFEVSGIWMDEVQKTDRIAYQNLLGRRREHGKLGWITATFTPGSPDHWTSTEFVKTDNPGVKCFRASLRDNPFIERAVYDSMLRDLAASPLRIRREVHGELVYLEGAEWLPDYFEDCWFDEWPDDNLGGLKTVGLDPSKGNKAGKVKPGDYSAFVMCRFVNGIFYLDADMKNDRDSRLITEAGVELFRTWRPHYFGVEEEMGQDHLIAMMQDLADSLNMPMPIVPLGSEKISKTTRILRWGPYISNRRIRFKRNSPGAKLLREQFMAFPQGEFDDGPDAAEYAMRLVVKAVTGQMLPPAVRTSTSYGQMGAA